ncbi:hypothetical protein [Alistipes putredinis]|uniref:hypothetical protein n=1 Tax=Alistipes putredinis TaxID=28117 RepID=UPI003A843F10
MWLIELGTICVTVAVVVRVWWLVVQVLRARNKRRLLSRMFGVVSDSPDFIGISAICHDIDSVSQVADLLDVEYASYELLVVMDARLKPELFHEMLRHYRMMRVDYHPFEACSQLGVRGFYRSQTRGVNRLTLLDQMEAFSAVSSDAAVRAASYDYILPIGRNLPPQTGCDRPSGDGVGGSSDPLYIVRADCRRTFAATLCPGVCRPVGSFRPGRRV